MHVPLCLTQYTHHLVLIGCFVFGMIARPVIGQTDSELSTPFSNPRIDIGCVVSDIDAALNFYTKAIGFKVTGGFQVSGDFSGDIALTKQKPLDVKVLTLGEGNAATQLKLMQIGKESSKANNDYIHSNVGFSYITIYVKEIEAAVNRLKVSGIKPMGKTPINLPGNAALGIVVIRDPDGNFVELVGPFKG